MREKFTAIALTIGVAFGAFALNAPASADPAPAQLKYGIDALQSTTVSAAGGWSFPFYKEQHGR